MEKKQYLKIQCLSNKTSGRHEYTDSKRETYSEQYKHRHKHTHINTSLLHIVVKLLKTESRNLESIQGRKNMLLSKKEIFVHADLLIETVKTCSKGMAYLMY